MIHVCDLSFRPKFAICFLVSMMNGPRATRRKGETMGYFMAAPIVKIAMVNQNIKVKMVQIPPKITIRTVSVNLLIDLYPKNLLQPNRMATDAGGSCSKNCVCEANSTTPKNATTKIALRTQTIKLPRSSTMRLVPGTG